MPAKERDAFKEGHHTDEHHHDGSRGQHPRHAVVPGIRVSPCCTKPSNPPFDQFNLSHRCFSQIPTSPHRECHVGEQQQAEQCHYQPEHVWPRPRSMLLKMGHGASSLASNSSAIRKGRTVVILRYYYWYRDQRIWSPLDRTNRQRRTLLQPGACENSLSAPKQILLSMETARRPTSYRRPFVPLTGHGKFPRFYRRLQKGCGWPAIWRCQIRTTAIDAASPLRDNFTTVDNSRRHYPADHGKGSDNSRPLGSLHRR